MQQSLKDDDANLQSGDVITSQLEKPRADALPNPVVIAPAPIPPTPVSPSSPSQRTESPAPIPVAGQVIFHLSLIEDRGGDFAEFEPLRNAPLMVSDSKTTLAAIRMLSKHDLTKTISDPTMVTQFGRPASFFIGEQIPIQNGKTIEYLDNGFKTDLVAQDAGHDDEGRTMNIELSWKKSKGKLHHDVDCKFLIHEGQTVVINTQHPKPDAEVDGKWPVYLIVTPELVK